MPTMTEKPDSFETVLAHWESPTLMSADLGIPYVTAQVMRHRKSIGDQHWPRLIEALAVKGIHLTTDDLLRMKFKRREEKQRERDGVAA